MVTRGQRVLMVGGQGVRAPQRDGIAEALQLAPLDWVTSERGQASHNERLSERVRSGSYDAVFFLSAFTSHKSGAFLRDCKRSRVPIVFLSRGYGLTRVIDAVKSQLPGRRAAS